jgi:hypothetical protein
MAFFLLHMVDFIPLSCLYGPAYLLFLFIQCRWGHWLVWWGRIVHVMALFTVAIAAASRRLTAMPQSLYNSIW